MLAAAVLVEAGPPSCGPRCCRALPTGSRIGAVGLAATETGGAVRDELVPGGGLADVVLLVVGDDVLVSERFERSTRAGVLDPTRRPATVTARGGTRIPGAATVARRLARTLAAAEAAGLAGACLDMAVAYAQQRKQFGRTIGTFQAVKHHCADLLLDAELAVAAAWDAAARSVGLARGRARGGGRGGTGGARRRARRGARPSSCTAASASPGSTTRTCTCAAR